MADGVVVHVGYFGGTYADNPWWIEPSFAGYVVTIDYGPYLSHYAHCSGSAVAVGQRVNQGQTVAYSGNTGSATSGPHLHWEVMPDGYNLGTSTYGRIDPRSILSLTPATNEEGFLMALTDQQQKDIYWMLCKPDGRAFMAQMIGAEAANKTLNTEIQRGGAAGKTSLAGMVAWNDAHVNSIVDAVAKATGADIGVIKQAVADGLKAGVHVEVSVGGSDGPSA
jgi:murein DD-endopeptidase MepM/ murein hydrolase activator NlpD